MRGFKQEKRITVIVGAGALYDINGSSIDSLTKAVEKADEVSEKILESLGEHATFEHLFHALEVLASFSADFDVSKDPMTYVLKSRFEDIDQCQIQRAILSLIDTICQSINGYCVDFENKKDLEYSWYKMFWGSLGKERSDIITLNYDDTIETSLEHYCDGFYNNRRRGSQIFNELKFMKSQDKCKLLHLHGCYEYGLQKIHRGQIEDASLSCAKYKDYNSARSNYFGNGGIQTQSGVYCVTAPIITGLNKLEKIQCQPYAAYYSELERALFSNSKLLVVGYSFGDYYINNLIARARKVNSKMHMVVVDKIPEIEELNSAHCIIRNGSYAMERLMSHGLISNIAQIFPGEEWHFGEGCLKSKMVTLYVKGFEDFARAHYQGFGF